MFIQNSDIFAKIITITVVILILGMGLPVLTGLYFRRKRLHLQEKEKMNQNFETELFKTHMEVQEQTMQTIASDLHDNIGQLLSLTSVTLNSINLDDPIKAKKKIDSSLVLLNTSIKELRDLAKLFHGEQLIEAGLAHALQQELNWLSKTDSYQLTVNSNLDELTLSSPAKDLIILRIAQECINNIIKHAQATNISIQMKWKAGIFQLQITDNGIGYDFEKAIAQKNGMGLHSLQKRANLIGGKIDIDTALGKGTSLHIEIPYP